MKCCCFYYLNGTAILLDCRVEVAPLLDEDEDKLQLCDVRTLTLTRRLIMKRKYKVSDLNYEKHASS